MKGSEGRRKSRERGRELLPFIGSLPKCLQEPAMHQVKVRIWERNPGLPYVEVRDSRTWPNTCYIPGYALTGSWIESTARTQIWELWYGMWAPQVASYLLCATPVPFFIFLVSSTQHTLHPCDWPQNNFRSHGWCRHSNWFYTPVSIFSVSWTSDQVLGSAMVFCFFYSLIWHHYSLQSQPPLLYNVLAGLVQNLTYTVNWIPRGSQKGYPILGALDSVHHNYTLPYCPCHRPQSDFQPMH